MKNLISKTNRITLYVVLLSISIGIVITMPIWFFSNLFWGWSFADASYAGWALWIIIYGGNLKHFWIFPDPNFGEILQNNLMRGENKIIRNTKTDIEKPRGQRAVFSGINGKWPWEERVGGPISLVKTTPLGDTVTGQARDSRNITVKWEGALAPIPDDNLVWFHRTDESAVITLRKADINIRIKGRIRGANSEKILKNPKQFFKELLEGMYGGDKVDESEEQTARYVSQLTIEDVSLEESSQDVEENLRNAQRIAETISTVLPAAGNNAIVQQMAVAAALRQKLDGTGVLNILGQQDGKENHKKGGKK